MKASRIQTMYLRRKSITKDGEGVPAVVWGSATQLKGEHWPAGGQLQVQTYGDRVNYMKNVRIRGEYQIITENSHTAYQFSGFTLCEGDGLCIDVDSTNSPDYKIISIRPYKPLRLEVERI